MAQLMFNKFAELGIRMIKYLNVFTGKKNTESDFMLTSNSNYD